MPFEIFTDSRGQRHEIYMQEKNVSCTIAKELDMQYRNALECAYINYQSYRMTLDLESGQRLPGDDDIILGAEEPDKNAPRP